MILTPNDLVLLDHTNPRMTERYLRDDDVPVVMGPAMGQQKAQR